VARREQGAQRPDYLTTQQRSLSKRKAKARLHHGNGKYAEALTLAILGSLNLTRYTTFHCPEFRYIPVFSYGLHTLFSLSLLPPSPPPRLFPLHTKQRKDKRDINSICILLLQNKRNSVNPVFVPTPSPHPYYSYLPPITASTRSWIAGS